MVADGIGDQLGLAMNAKLPHHLASMSSDGLRRDVQKIGHVAGARTLSDELEDLTFTTRKSAVTRPAGRTLGMKEVADHGPGDGLMDEVVAAGYGRNCRDKIGGTRPLGNDTVDPGA